MTRTNQPGQTIYKKDRLMLLAGRMGGCDDQYLPRDILPRFGQIFTLP